MYRNNKPLTNSARREDQTSFLSHKGCLTINKNGLVSLENDQATKVFMARHNLLASNVSTVKKDKESIVKVSVLENAVIKLLRDFAATWDDVAQAENMDYIGKFEEFAEYVIDNSLGVLENPLTRKNLSTALYQLKNKGLVLQDNGRYGAYWVDVTTDLEVSSRSKKLAAHTQKDESTAVDQEESIPVAKVQQKINALQTDIENSAMVVEHLQNALKQISNTSSQSTDGMYDYLIGELEQNIAEVKQWQRDKENALEHVQDLLE